MITWILVEITGIVKMNSAAAGWHFEDGFDKKYHRNWGIKGDYGKKSAWSML
jgi:hypothetical protein